MDHEKKYKETIEAIKQLVESNPSDENIQNWANDNFPELKMNENERIRKAILTGLIDCRDAPDLGWSDFGGIEIDECIDWFEKQDEQKPYSGVSFEYNGHTWGMCARDGGVEILMDSNLKAFVSLDKSFIYPIRTQPILVPKSAHEVINEKMIDNANKVEPKFHEGEWVTNGIDCIFQIASIKNGIYYDTNNCGSDIESTDKSYRLWTIRDAKDGDVIVCPKYAGDIIPNIFIFKNIEIKDDDVICHCSFLKAFSGTGGYIANADSINNDFYPATKEQRDILLKAMDKAGYTFDFEKKELKQKPDWSEEDKNFMYDTLSNLTELKDRYGEEYGNVGKCIEWVKSIRPQKQWKPSNDQIVALEHFVRSIWESEFASPYNNNIKLVYLLLKQLKELKE